MMKPPHSLCRVVHDKYTNDCRCNEFREHDSSIAKQYVVVVSEAIPDILGQPNPYTWAEQNYNAGHDQAIHKVRAAIDSTLVCCVRLRNPY